MLFCWWADGGGLHRNAHDPPVMTPSSGSSFQDEPIGKCLGFISGDGKVSILTPSGDGKSQAVTQNFDLKKDKIKVMRSGQTRALLVRDDGEIFYMEMCDSCRPFKVLCDRKVTQVACGNQHTIAVISDGQLLVWGENSFGQLGLGKKEGNTSSPQPLRSLCGIPVVRISAGGDHSFALSISGAVFGWGRNDTGQLGLGDTTDRYTPTCVKSLNLKKTIFISCGEKHSAILTKGGVVFTFGSGSYGQLGHGSQRDERHPRLVAELLGSKVSQIACGKHHTLALSESLNVIYSFGCGEQGQLGNKTPANQSVPLPILTQAAHSPALKVKRIIAYGNVSFAQFSHEEKHETSVTSHTYPAVDDVMIDRWLEESNTDGWKQSVREIRRMFSSASCVNGSFIDESCDKHFWTSAEYSGLDLSLARLAFEKIARKPTVLFEVQHTVTRNLLCLDVPPAGVEALRVYLILPELIRVLQENKQQTQLAAALAGAIANLDPCDALESLWSRMPYSFFRTLVKTFHSASVLLITQMTKQTQNSDHWNSLITILCVLKKLFMVNRRRKCALLEGQFCITELGDLMERHGKILRRNIEKLVPFGFVADFTTKQKIFIHLKAKLQEVMNVAGQPAVPVNKLQIKRRSLLQDTLKYLKQNQHKFSQPLMVEFLGERGIDGGGVSAQFFSLISSALIAWEKKLLKAFEDSRLFWFSTNGCDVTDYYYLGIICGLALYNLHCVSINFPLVLFKKLLDLSSSLDDLEELTPVEARSLKNVLGEDGDVVDQLDLCFMVKDQELVPNGAQIPVTKMNRQKFVDLYVDFIFSRSVRTQFEQFAEGFSKACPVSAWRMFSPEELRELLCGSPVYEWEALQRNAAYEGCTSSDLLIRNFWAVFRELSEEQKKKFLFFLYGTDRVPAGGLSKLRLKIVQLNLPHPDDRFPEAQTCVGKLLLPKYRKIETLRDKLKHAINYCEVFGRE